MIHTFPSVDIADFNYVIHSFTKLNFSTYQLKRPPLHGPVIMTLSKSQICICIFSQKILQMNLVSGAAMPSAAFRDSNELIFREPKFLRQCLVFSQQTSFPTCDLGSRGLRHCLSGVLNKQIRHSKIMLNEPNSIVIGPIAPE